MAVVAMLLLFIFIRTYKTRKAVKKILRDNNLMIDGETKVWLTSNEKITIYNYRKKSNEHFDQFLEILEAERGERYYYKRKDSVITIKKFPEPPKAAGIYLQSVKNGEIKKYQVKAQSNGILIAGKTGSGKSVLITKLLEQTAYTELLIISPKADEDFQNGKFLSIETENALLEMIENASNGQYKNKAPAIIILDEIITLSKIFKKDTIEKINVALTIIRSQNLRIWVATQKLQKTSVSIDISLLTEKILNVSDIKNFTESLGIDKLRTLSENLKTGQFIYYCEGDENILHNRLGEEK
jgi:DNA replication protein DnaC